MRHIEGANPEVEKIVSITTLSTTPTKSCKCQCQHCWLYLHDVLRSRSCLGLFHTSGALKLDLNQCSMLHLNIIRLDFKWLYMYQSKLFCIGQWKNSVIMSKPVLIKWIDKINFLVKIIFIIHYTEYGGVKNDKVLILV